MTGRGGRAARERGDRARIGRRRAPSARAGRGHRGPRADHRAKLEPGARPAVGDDAAAGVRSRPSPTCSTPRPACRSDGRDARPRGQPLGVTRVEAGRSGHRRVGGAPRPERERERVVPVRRPPRGRRPGRPGTSRRCPPDTPPARPACPMQAAPSARRQHGARRPAGDGAGAAAAAQAPRRGQRTARRCRVSIPVTWPASPAFSLTRSTVAGRRSTVSAAQRAGRSAGCGSRRPGRRAAAIPRSSSSRPRPRAPPPRRRTGARRRRRSRRRARRTR